MLLTSGLKFPAVVMHLSTSCCQVIYPHCTSQDEIDFDWPSWKQKSLLERVQDPGLSAKVSSFCCASCSCHVQSFHWSMHAIGVMKFVGTLTVTSYEWFVHSVGPDTPPFFIKSCRCWKNCSNLVKMRMLLRRTRNRAMGPSTTYSLGDTSPRGSFC